MDAQKIRFGILGCSRVAHKHGLPAIIESEFSTLTMIGSRSKETARHYAKLFNCDSFGTYEEVLSNPDVDAVYISLPNALHEEWSIKAAMAGKHIWCEKPAALTYASAKKMVEASKDHAVLIREGFTFLFHPQHMEVRKHIKNETLGELISFAGQFTFPHPDIQSNLYNNKLGGGSYNDSAVYLIRASRMVFNEEPTTISCNLIQDKKTQVDIKADIILTYSGKRTAILSSAFGTYFQSTYSILGSEALLKTERAYAVPPDKKVKIFLERNDKVEEISVTPANQFTLFVDDFSKEILRGTEKNNYKEDLLLQARILEAGRISNNEGRTVKITDIQ